jgi:hypothetical protein
MTPRRRDNNHAAIREGLRQCGFFVSDTAEIGNGFPDLLAVSKSGVAVLLEVKVPGEHLTEMEKVFHVNYPGPIAIVRSPEEAIDVMEDWQ